MKNSHRLIVLFLSAQLLFLSGCTETSTSSNNGNGGSSVSPSPITSISPSVSGNSDAMQKICLESVNKYKTNLRKDSAGVDIFTSKIPSSFFTQKAKDLEALLNSTECKTSLDKTKLDIEGLIKNVQLAIDIQNNQGNIKKAVESIGLTEVESVGDDLTLLSRRLVKYTEQKLGDISKSLENPNVDTNAESPKLKKQIEDLKKQIEDLRKEVERQTKEISELKSKISPNQKPISGTTDKPESKGSSLFSDIANLIGFGALAVIVGGTVYMLRGKQISLDFFNSSHKKGATKNTVKGKQRGGLGSRGDSPSTPRSQSHWSGTNDDWRNRDGQPSGGGDKYEQDRHDESNETVDNIKNPVKKLPESNTSTSISQANQDFARQQIQPINQVTHLLTYEQAFNTYHEDYRLLEPYMQNGYYSATVESITLNRQYSESPLQLSSCPKYKSLFWIIETSDYGAVLFPNPEVRIDNSRIQALKYFFNNNNFKDSNYQAWEVFPALMKANNKGQLVRQKKGELTFDY